MITRRQQSDYCGIGWRVIMPASIAKSVEDDGRGCRISGIRTKASQVRRLLETLLVALIVANPWPAATLGQSASSSDGASSSPTTNALERNACGPSCLGFVFRHFEIDDVPDLVDLIIETDANSEKGASVEALLRSLRRRGIYAEALSTRTDAKIEWPHPVIVVIRSDETSESVPHFVILLPSQDRDVLLWDGISGVQRLSHGEFEQRWLGHMILTSSAPIDDPMVAVHFRHGIDHYFFVILCTLVAGACAAVALVRMSPRSKT